jgi:hypothetical protein
MLYMKKISYFLVIAAIAVFSASCGQKTASDAASNVKLIAEGPYETFVAATDMSPAHVIINKPQVNLDEFPKCDDGWITIFDGSFKGWRGYDQDVVPVKWIYDEESMRIVGGDGGEAHSEDGGDIMFAYKFKNFELTFDWKVARGSNSGIFYLAREVKGEPIWVSSPEYQIVDNVNHIDGRTGTGGNRMSASLYDMIPAVPQNSKPFGEWNTGAITVYQGSVFHWQNGEVVLEYHLWTPKWEELISSGKFRRGGDYPLAYNFLVNLGDDDRSGYIGFQDHGGDVWYRNLKVKILD